MKPLAFAFAMFDKNVMIQEALLREAFLTHATDELFSDVILSMLEKLFGTEFASATFATFIADMSVAATSTILKLFSRSFDSS